MKDAVPSGLPDPVFEFDGGPTGTQFDGTEQPTQPQDAVDKIKDLTQGTIVVSFEVEDKNRKIEHIVTVSNNDDSSRFCFCVHEGVYGAYAHEDKKAINQLSSVRYAYGVGRITAVLSVSQTNGTFLMTSQDVEATNRDSTEKDFFASIKDIDSLRIGKDLKGTIYFINIYDEALTSDEAASVIKQSYKIVPFGSSYVRTTDREFQFAITPGWKEDDLDVAFEWEFPDSTKSFTRSPVWMVPKNNTDLFKSGLPVEVKVTAKISSPGTHYGFRTSKTFYVEPDSGIGNQAPHSRTWVIKHGEEGFGCYRIPSIIRAGNGDLLTVFEARPRLNFKGRKCHDHQSGISVGMKRSVDNGMTWGPLEILGENIVPTNGKRMVSQNPTIMLDETDEDNPQGKVILIYNDLETKSFDQNINSFVTGGVRRSIMQWSPDHGHNWKRDPVSNPEGTMDGDITDQVHYPYAPGYTAVYDADYAKANYNKSEKWSFTQPTQGHSIQLRNLESTKGRLLVTGAYANIGDVLTSNYLVWSDDHGKSWEMGPMINSRTYWLNEAIAVELEDGSVLINTRAYNRWGRSPAGRVLTRVTFDKDGKASLDTPRRQPQLATKGRIGIAAGMARITSSGQKVFGAKSRIAFTAPNDDGKWILDDYYRYIRTGCNPRGCMNLWMSTDEGKNWNAYGQRPKSLNGGPSAYSDIVAFPDARVGVLYHGDLTKRSFVYGGMLFHAATLNWLSTPDGTDKATDQRALVRHDMSETEFDGSKSDELTRGDVGKIKDMEQGSIVMSFRTTQTDTDRDRVLFSVSGSGDPESRWSLHQTAKGRFGIHAVDDGDVVSKVDVSRYMAADGRWHRLAVTVGSEGTDIYLDGQLIAGDTEATEFFDVVDGLDRVTIGAKTKGTGTTGHWNGSIGTVEIFDGVLTPEQAISATQPAAIPVATWRIDDELTTANSITMNDAAGGRSLVEDHLPEWSPGRPRGVRPTGTLNSSWAVGASFTVPDTVTGNGVVFRAGSGGKTDLKLGVLKAGSGHKVGVRLNTPWDKPWVLGVDASKYSGQDISVIAVLSPEKSYLVINGEVVMETHKPIPTNTNNLRRSFTTIGDTKNPIGTHVKSVAIWKGVVPSERLAKSLTLTGDIAR